MLQDINLNDPNGAIKVVAECIDVMRISGRLDSTRTTLTITTNQRSFLPASGYNWSDWWSGTQVCEVT